MYQRKPTWGQQRQIAFGKKPKVGTGERTFWFLLTLLIAIAMTVYLYTWANTWRQKFWFMDDWKGYLFVTVIVIIGMGFLKWAIKMEWRISTRK